MSKKPDWVIPKNIKIHDVSMVLQDIDLEFYEGHYEARVTYVPKMAILDGRGTYTVRFDSNERFMDSLALAGGEVLVG